MCAERAKSTEGLESEQTIACSPKAWYCVALVIKSGTSALACLREGVVVLALPCLIMALFLVLYTGRAFADDLRLVPQLGLTKLVPIMVSFAPDRDDLLMVVNDSGRIDLFDIGDPDRPIRSAEFSAASGTAAFSPDGSRIVSGGLDGTVRLWATDGTPTADPFEGHGGRVWSVAFSPDGSRIVSGGDDGTVRLWTLDGKPAAEPFEGHDETVLSVAFAPDGSRIVSGGSDGTVRLWTLDGTPVAEPFWGHFGTVMSVAFAPDGSRIISGGDDGTVRLWTLDGTPAAEPFWGHFGTVMSVAFAPDGSRIVSGGSDGTVRLWTLNGTPAAEPFEGHEGSVWSVAFSPDGSRIVSGAVNSGIDDHIYGRIDGRIDGAVRLWTLEGTPAAEPFSGHDGRVWSAAFSPDGSRIVSGGSDGTVRLWTRDGTPAAAPFGGHFGRVWRVAFSPDGSRIVSGGSDGTVRLWALDGTPAAAPFRGHDGRVLSVAFSPDGSRIASGGSDGTVRLWTLDGTSAAALFKGHDGSVWSVAFSPDGSRIVSSGSDGTVRLWALDGTPAAAPFEGHDGRVLSAAFSSDGSRIVSGGSDGTVRLWALDGMPATEPFWGHVGTVMSVAFAPDGSRIVSGGLDATVRLWALDGTPAAAPFEGHDGTVLSAAFSPDGSQIVSSGLDGTVRLWTLIGTPAAAPLRGHKGAMLGSLAFSSDGSRIVSGGWDGTVRLWALDGTSAAAPLEGHDGSVWSVAFSPDGSRIVSGGSDGTVRLWALDGTPVAEPFRGHFGTVMSVAFSPDGSHIVSGGWDEMVRLWALDGTPAAEPFRGHDSMVWGVAFSPDGSRIVSGGLDGTVRLWTLDGTPAAAPFEGHDGSVLSVAFSPDGDRIVSGGDDGTVRLWALDGTPAAAPFEGHDNAVWRVAFSPDGGRIVSGGLDGKVRVWTVAHHHSSVVHQCFATKGFGYLTDRVLWIGCHDRVVFLSADRFRNGELFFSDDGLVAITAEAVYAQTDQLHAQVRAFSEDGTRLLQRGAVPGIAIDRARQILLEDWTLWDRFVKCIYDAYQWAHDFYTNLGWGQAPFLLALAWLIVVLPAAIIWVFAARKLADWAMPVAGTPALPRWKWAAGVITLYGYFGTTRRSLKKWLRHNRDALYRANFSERKPVELRERYCNLGNEDIITAFVNNLKDQNAALVWITGTGGSGKSALAYRMLRVSTERKPTAPLPVLVDEDWDGTLASHVAALMQIGKRAPTEVMVEKLGALGLICPLVDSLSERGVSKAVDSVGNAVRQGIFKALVVTSRSKAPEGKTWEIFTERTTHPLTADQIPDYVATYAPSTERNRVHERILPLVETKQNLSPLFVRFAVEQAMCGEMTATSTLDLVLRYVEKLRADRIDVSRHDMVRAASIAALETIRDSLVPREIEQAHLAWALVKEADELSFMNAANDHVVPPSKIIEMLVQCGLLNRNKTNLRLQFAYDPVAEYLAANLFRMFPERKGLQALKARIIQEAPSSALAHAILEVEKPVCTAEEAG